MMAKNKPPYKPAHARQCTLRGKTRWMVEWHVWDERKKEYIRHRRVINAKQMGVPFTDKECAQRMAIYQNERLAENLGKDKEVKPEQVGKIVADMLEITLPTLRKGSLGNYRRAAKMFCAWCGQLTTEDIERKHIVSWLDHLSGTLRLKAHARNTNLSVIRALLQRAVERGHLENNPAMKIARLKPTASLHTPFTDAEALRLNEWMRSHDYHLYLFTRVIYFTFIRPGEIRQLQCRHVNADRNQITIPGAVSKNKKTQSVHIPDTLARELALRIEGEPADSYLFGKDLKVSTTPHSKNTPQNAHKRALLGAGVKNNTLYSWKHTGVCKAYIKVNDIKAIQRQLRHSRLETTDIYLQKLGLVQANPLKGIEW